jgi:hypothetical protein
VAGECSFQFSLNFLGGTAKKVTKIVCFGMGDMNLNPLDWRRIQNDELAKIEQTLETSMVEMAMIHHAMALTVAGIVCSYANQGVRLLTQDQQCIDQTRNILLATGFGVVGDCGAESFAEVDDLYYRPLPMHRFSKSLQNWHIQW